MRILKIQIENFGTLSHENIDIESDLHEILRENGWGKTTLATFIKCIFYGLGGKQKKSSEENEFKKYRPWQGGVFGGSILFEVKGKTYRVERFFEDTKSERFALFDAHTGLKSTDYGERLGEELFCVNAESFERSIYLPQKELKNDRDSGILRYLENAIEDKKDDSNYDTAADSLEKAIKYYVPARMSGNRKGRLEEIKDALATTARNIENCNVCARECRTKQETLNAIRENIQALQARHEEIQRHIESAKSSKVKNALLQNLEEMTDEAAETETKLRQLDTVLNGQTPTEEELNAQFTLAREISDISARLTERSSLAMNDVYEEDALFENIDPDTMRQIKNLAHTADEQRRQIQSSQKSARPKIMLPAFMIAAILIAFGAVSAFYLLAMGIVLMGVGVLACVALLILGFRKADRENGLHRDTIQERAKNVLILDRFLSQLGIPTDELDEYFPTIEKVEIKYSDFLRRIEKIKAVQSQNEELESALNDKQNQLRRFFSAFSLRQAQNPESALFELQSCIREKAQYLKKLRAQNERIAAFKSRHSAELEAYVPPEHSYEELISRQNELLSSERTFREQALNLEKEIAELEHKAEELPLLLAEKEKLDEENQKAQTCYDVLMLTKNYLNQAKERLSGSYLGDMKNSFSKYFSLFRFEENEQIHLDIDLNISIERYGSAKEVTAFSRGIRDIIGLCLRFSLLDAMYQDKEKPTVVLDDPFVNLDDKRLPAALKLLQDLSKEYQIIYLTCSKTRLPT